MAFATEYSWIIASLVFLMGVLIRHYFNSLYTRKGKPHWTPGRTALIFIWIMWLSSIPMYRDYDFEAEVVLPENLQHVVASAEFEDVRNTALGRCSMCDNAEPVWPGIRWAPNSVRLDDDAQIATNARSIYLHAGVSHAMPPGNVTAMSEEERMQIVRWYRGLRSEAATLED